MFNMYQVLFCYKFVCNDYNLLSSLSSKSLILYLPSDFNTCHHHINFESKIMTCHINKNDIVWTNCDMTIYI